ncbi:MAG: adenosine kinase, partial [Hyphomicrobium sp.]
MAEARYDVIGIGNAIVDIIGRCDEAFLAQVGVAKGSMRLVDAGEIKT